MHNETEALLIRSLTDVIGFKSIDLDQHFVDLGGDSLMAVQLMGHLSRELGEHLSPILPFEADTLRDLAERINAIRRPRGTESDGSHRAIQSA